MSSAPKITASETDLPMGLSQPALRALLQNGYGSIATAASLTEAELLELHGVGPSALPILRQAFEEAGVPSPLRSN